MLQEHVGMVAGDFNGAAWRRQSGSDPRPISIIEEAFTKTSLPVPPGPLTVVATGRCTRWMGWRMRFSETTGFWTRMASSDAWSLHHPMWHAGAKREGSKLPSRSLGTSFSRQCPSRWTCAAVQSGPAVIPKRDSPCDHSTERGPTEKKATIRWCHGSSVSVPATPLMSSPSFSDPMRNKRPLPLPVCCSQSFCVTHCITSHCISHCTRSTVSKKRRSQRSTNKSRTVWRKNSIHVDVQRH